MKLNDYQEQALATAKYPGQGGLMGIVYGGLKLNGEAGEFAEHLGKAIRDDDCITPERRVLMLKELGDVLWYVAALASELHSTLDDVAHINIAKLADRASRGVLGGSGDNR